MKNKKSQLRIQEMAFMLVAIFLFFALAGLIAFSILYSNLKDKVKEAEEGNTLTALSSLADSPELGCVGSKVNCVDGDKIMALMNNKNYKNFWPFSSLTIVRMDAFKKNERNMIECTMQNYPNCERFVIFDKNVKERTLSTFVALCRNELENGINYQKCEIAKIIAGTNMEG